MNTAEIKVDIIKELSQTEDIGLLEEVHDLIGNYKEKIIGYRPDGTPLGAKEFRKQAKEAIQRVKNGHFSTIEELRAQIKD